MKRRRRRQGWRSNQDRINQRLANTDWRYRGQSFGATTPALHIDPASVNVNIPAVRPIIQPWWIEIPVDDAFWRVWKMNSVQMRIDGYNLYKIDGRWRAFLVKLPKKWRKARGRAG
jgi:hypothetical protein